MVFVLAVNGQAASGTEPTFSELVEVDVVNVEVHVVDKKGSPVTDLDVGEFKVFEDGQPVAISHFSLVGRTHVNPSTKGLSNPTATSSSGQQADLITGNQVESQPLWLVVYIDNLNIRPFDRQRSLRALGRFLEENLGSDAQVMLVSFDRSIRVHQSFTRDAESIAKALTEIEATPCYGARYDDERRDLLQRIDDLQSPRIAVETFKYLADSIQHDARRTLDAMERVLGSLSGLPGRKALLHVSSGLPAVPAAELFMAVEYKFEIGYGVIRMQEWDMKDDYRLLARSANLHGVTIYTLDAAGIRAANSASVHQVGYKTAKMAGPVDADTGVNLQLPLRQLADETGGYAIVNRNDPGPALQTVAESLRTHYSLGISPDHSGDGEYHTLRVEVARKGARVHHRSGYIDRSAETLRSERLQASLMFSIEDNPLGIDLTIGDVVESDVDRFIVPLELGIPLDGLVLLDKGAEHRGSLRILIAVMDETGRISEVVESPLGLSISDDKLGALMEERWLYTHRLILKSGEHTVALGVHDEISGVTTYLRRTALVGI
jgi:VWFA-related protein